MIADDDFDLLLAYLDDELDDSEVAALVARLRCEPELAGRLVVLAAEEGKIVEWAGATSRPAPAGEVRSGLPPVAPPKAPFPSAAFAVEAAVVLLALGAVIGIGLWLAFTNGGPAPETPVARQGEPSHDAHLVRATGCRWANDRVPTIDDGRLVVGSILDLLEGVAEVEYASGVRIVVEGPARFAVADADAGELTAGRLSATVPKSAAGFTIQTPALDVIDRGTQFGAQVDAGGPTEVHVFQGEVEAVTRGADETPRVRQILSTAQAARFDSRGHFDAWLEPDPRAFPGVRRGAAGVTSTDRAMRWLPQPPPALGEGELPSGSDMFLFLERRGVVLPRRVQITTFQRRGSQAHFSTEEVTLPAGTRVDSYLVHFDPGASAESRHGGVRFTRPVVGLIARGDQLRASDDLFGAPGTRYAFTRPDQSGLDDTHRDGQPDVVLYPQPDGLSFALKPEPGTVDEVRILVAAEKP